VDLLVVSFGVEEVDSATAGPNYRAVVVMTLSLQELQGLIESFRGYFKGLMGNAVFLKSVATQRTRTLKKHYVRIAAFQPC
jgi:hypothetical protein